MRRLVQRERDGMIAETWETVYIPFPRWLAVATILFALLGIGLVSAQPVPAALSFPVVGNQAQPSASLDRMVDVDCGFVTATAAPDGRIFVAYQTRPDGTVWLAEDKGPYFAKIAIPPVNAPPIIQPQGDDDGLPGPKQGSASVVVIGGVMRVYFTGRAVGDLTGPFYVWRLTMPVPAPETALLDASYLDFAWDGQRFVWDGS